MEQSSTGPYLDFFLGYLPKRLGEIVEEGRVRGPRAHGHIHEELEVAARTAPAPVVQLEAALVVLQARAVFLLAETGLRQEQGPLRDDVLHGRDREALEDTLVEVVYLDLGRPGQQVGAPPLFFLVGHSALTTLVFGLPSILKLQAKALIMRSPPSFFRSFTASLSLMSSSLLTPRIRVLMKSFCSSIFFWSPPSFSAGRRMSGTTMRSESGAVRVAQ